MANVEFELQDAIVDHLKADPAVTALIGARVYDSVKQGAVFPYVTIGPVQTISDDADCITGYEVAQQIDCWSRAPGFPEVKKIIAAVRASLHNFDLPLPTNALVFFQFRTDDIRRDPDGITSHGILSFEAAVEEH